jgi:hypothetical protein
MDSKQLAMILRIIKNSGHPKLSGVLKEAMARNCKEVVQEVHNQATPLFQHLIPLIAMRKKNLAYPTNWPGEIQGCLYIQNSCKKWK